MTKRILITDDMLVGACENQRKLFRETWPAGAAVTKANAIKAAKLGLDVDWVAENLLPSPLDDDYRAKRNPLDDDYWAKRKRLDDDYRAKRKRLYDDYLIACWVVLYPLLRKALADNQPPRGEGEKPCSECGEMYKSFQCPVCTKQPPRGEGEKA